MILYFLIATITIALACQVDLTAYSDKTISRQKVLNATAMAAIFCILTALAALRVEVGNDYCTYVVTCHEIFQRGYVVTEPGYNLVVRILYTLSGKEDHLLMFAVFGAAIVLVFLKSFKDQSDDFALTFFLFMTMGIYFMSYNTVRYYFALAVTLYSLRYLAEPVIDWQNLVKFLVLIAFAATFHKSVLAVIPMYLICRLPWNKWIIALLCFAGLVDFIFSNKLMNLLLILYPSYKDTVYLEESRALLDNGPIIARCILVLALGLFFYKDSIKDNIANRTYFNMNIMAIIMYLTCWWMPLITRFGYYLITAHILLIPGVITSVQDDRKRRILKYLVILFGIAYFVYFLVTATHDGIRVLPYKSWLFYDGEWLNQTDLT